MRKGFLFFFLFVVLMLDLKAQVKLDSLIAVLPSLSDTVKVHALNFIASQIGFKDVVKGREYADQAIVLSQKINFLDGEAESLCIICSLLDQQGQFVQALESCHKAESIYEKSKNKNGLADLYNRLGSVYNQKGEHSHALENFLKSLKIRQELNQKNEVAKLVENIGIVYFRQGDYPVALKYFKDCHHQFTELNNSASASKILVNLGATYNRLKMFPQALEANLKSLEYFEQVNNMIGVGIASNNVGNVYIEMKDFGKAISYYEKSLSVKQKMNDKRGTAVSLRNIAEAYIGMNNLGKAKESIDKSLKIAEEIGSKEQIKDAYDILAKLFEQTKNYEQALNYEKKMAQAKDSLFSADKTEQISRMRAIYETEKAEQEARIVKIEAEKKDVAITVLNKENELKNSQRNFFVAVAGSLLVMVLLALYLYRQKQKSNALLSEKNLVIEKSLRERETLLKEIHHRVKNNLQIISSLLSLQSKSLTDTDAQGAISESRNRVKSMALIHEQLYQEDTISGVDMKDYIQRLVNSLTSSYGLDTERIEIKIVADDILLDVDSAIPLGLIINELVSNSMKYAFPEKKSGTILISLHEMMSELKLIVQDDGVGMDESKKSNQSFGLSMVNSLMRKLKAEMNIVSDAGTSVELVIKDFRKVSFG